MLMHQKIIRQILLVLYLLLNYDGVQGKTMLSKIEELELEEQLKLLNKPSIKTVKSKSGDIYNCVDFYKQPAFDHPLLKNHNFHPEMKPTLTRSKWNSSTWSSRIWSKGVDCPFGTVPIRQITKEDLIRQRNMPPPENHINSKNELESRYISSRGYKLAIVRTPKNPNAKFGGAGMEASVYNPHVEGQQHSACRVKIQNESDIIQVGWRVDPTLYGDNITRSFVHLQAGDKHCFNLLCPGFVQVNSRFAVDSTFKHITQRGDRTSWAAVMSIERDPANGNWWVLLQPNHEKLGFWPQKIFTSLASFANNIEWGGVAYSPSDIPEPPMGSSYFPIGDVKYDAYCRGLAILNDKGETVDVDITTIYVDDTNLYRVLDRPHMEPGKFKHFVLFGGPGESQQL